MHRSGQNSKIPARGHIIAGGLRGTLHGRPAAATVSPGQSHQFRNTESRVQIEHAQLSLLGDRSENQDRVQLVESEGATLMIVMLLLHMLRVFVTGAFRDYRWGAWMVGIGLLGVTLGMAFTGYALIRDPLSYWGITVTSNIIAALPLVGGKLRSLFLAGDTINEATTSRMYALHVQTLPSVLFLVKLLFY